MGALGPKGPEFESCLGQEIESQSAFLEFDLLQRVTSDSGVLNPYANGQSKPNYFQII